MSFMLYCVDLFHFYCFIRIPTTDSMKQAAVSELIQLSGVVGARLAPDEKNRLIHTKLEIDQQREAVRRRGGGHRIRLV